MTATVIPFPSKAKPRRCFAEATQGRPVEPTRGYDFEQEYREAWERAFSRSRGSDRPCDQEESP